MGAIQPPRCTYSPAPNKEITVRDKVAQHAADEAQLAALGYKSEFKREMSLWANFSLGFTYLSPVVVVYTLFAFALATGGPPMIWSLALVGIGQFLVALVFGEVVSEYPVAGGLYPWARHLWGVRWAWMTAWVYLVALLVSIASVVLGVGIYVAAVLGIEATVNTGIFFALLLIAMATVINFGGTKVLSYAAITGFTAELIGALFVGTWLLVGHRHHNLGVLFDSFGAGGNGSYFAAFAAAALIGIWQYYGFEACGDVAEEVPNPGLRIPKAMRLTMYVGGAAAMFLTLALILSVGSIGDVISGKSVDPVNEILTDAFGTTGAKVIVCIVLLSFLSCVTSFQAAASRLLYAFGRDKMILGSGLLSKFSQARHVPPYALLAAAVVPAVVVIGSKFSTDALTKVVSFATIGIYISFQMVVLAALRARVRGWRPSGPFTLGTWGMPVTVAALVYGIIAMVNLSWPRTPDAPFVDNYIVILSGLFVVGLGLVYMYVAKPHEPEDTPQRDAIPEYGPEGTRPSAQVSASFDEVEVQTKDEDPLAPVS